MAYGLRYICHKEAFYAIWHMDCGTHVTKKHFMPYGIWTAVHMSKRSILCHMAYGLRYTCHKEAFYAIWHMDCGTYVTKRSPYAMWHMDWWHMDWWHMDCLLPPLTTILAWNLEMSLMNPAPPPTPDSNTTPSPSFPCSRFRLWLKYLDSETKKNPHHLSAFPDFPLPFTKKKYVLPNTSTRNRPHTHVHAYYEGSEFKTQV